MGDFICANLHARLAIIYQSVVAPGQLQLQLLSANIVRQAPLRIEDRIPRSLPETMNGGFRTSNSGHSPSVVVVGAFPRGTPIPPSL